MFDDDVRRLDAYLTATMRRYIEMQDAQVSLDALSRRLNQLLKSIHHAYQIGLHFESSRDQPHYVDRVIFYVDYGYSTVGITVDQSHLPLPPPDYLRITAEIASEF